MRVLSIDAAVGRRKDKSQTGRALFETEGRQLLEYGTLSWEEIQKKGVRLKYLNQCDLLVIEDQYLGINIQSMKTLIETKCMWTVLARDEGIKVKEILPTEWQKGTCNGWFRGIKREQLEKMVRFYVESRFRLKPGVVPQDAISAIGIGSYVVDMIVMGRLAV